MKILIIEDDPVLNTCLQKALCMKGHTTLCTFSLQEATEKIRNNSFDVVLLDIMLPDGSSYNRISFIKQRAQRLLITSGLSDIESKRICYENGADDFLSKPFKLEELYWKLGAIERQLITNTQEEITFGDVTINFTDNTLACNNHRKYIPNSQLRLLKMLYKKNLEGEILNKEEVVCEPTNKNIDVGQRVRTLVARTRATLKEAGSQKVKINSIHSRGYKLMILNE